MHYEERRPTGEETEGNRLAKAGSSTLREGGEEGREGGRKK
jgi:hypothetical protein